MDRVRQDPNIPIPDLNDDDNHRPVNNSTSSSDAGPDGPVSKKRKYDTGSGDSNISGSRVYVLPNGLSPCNKYVQDMIDLVKPKVIQLVEDANMIKMWILFLIPRIEDGNNFGVSIQEDTLTEVRTVETEAATHFELVSRYYMSRGKVVAKIARYPHVVSILFDSLLLYSNVCVTNTGRFP